MEKELSACYALSQSRAGHYFSLSSCYRKIQNNSVPERAGIQTALMVDVVQPVLKGILMKKQFFAVLDREQSWLKYSSSRDRSSGLRAATVFCRYSLRVSEDTEPRRSSSVRSSNRAKEFSVPRRLFRAICAVEKEASACQISTLRPMPMWIFLFSEQANVLNCSSPTSMARASASKRKSSG